MVFRDNFKRFIEEKTGMKTSNFLKEYCLCEEN